MKSVTSIARGLSAALVTLAMVAGRGGAASAQDLSVTFPQGWTVTTLPIPSDGHPVAGSISRAMLSDQAGRLLAAIEFTREPQLSGRLLDLPEAKTRMQAGAKDVYGKAGLEFSCQADRPIQVAGIEGLDIQCDASRGDRDLVRQRIVMWSKPGMLASLSYTSPAGSFPNHIAAFQQSLASLDPQ